MNSFWCLVSQPGSLTLASTLSWLSLLGVYIKHYLTLSKAGFKGMWALQWHGAPHSEGPSAWSNALLSLSWNAYYLWLCALKVHLHGTIKYGWSGWGRHGISVHVQSCVPATQCRFSVAQSPTLRHPRLPLAVAASLYLDQQPNCS